MANDPMDPDDIGDDDLDVLLSLVDESPPPAGLRAALLGAAAGPWWAVFVRRAAVMLDLTEAQTSAVFAAMSEPDRWMPGPNDGLSLFHIDAGPAVEGAITGFVRLAPGASFPHHRHEGFEDVLVLEGSFHHGASEVKAGMEAPMPPASDHLVRAGDQGCVFLAVSRDGIAFDGEDAIGPDDPRA